MLGCALLGITVAAEQRFFLAFEKSYRNRGGSRKLPLRFPLGFSRGLISGEGRQDPLGVAESFAQDRAVHGYEHKIDDKVLKPMVHYRRDTKV